MKLFARARRIVDSQFAASLPAEQVFSLADLIRAGHGLVDALAVLPRDGLPARVRRQLDREVLALRGGETLSDSLGRLGLELTAGVARSAGADPQALEAMLRTDASTRKAAEEHRREALGKVWPLVLYAVMGLVICLFLALVVVPHQLRLLNEEVLGPGKELPPILADFEGYRNRWLLNAAWILGILATAPLLYASIFGLASLREFLHTARARVPLLREHARASARARLLESLASEVPSGVPVNETLRRVARLESVPPLRAELELAATRLEVGDPWSSCLAGTKLQDASITALGALSDQGATPIEGWRTASRESRAKAHRALRRSIIVGTLLALTPPVLFTAQLLRAALVTGSIAELKGVGAQLDSIELELQGLITPHESSRNPRKGTRDPEVNW